MKGLTLTQPWASAIAVGVKCVETRNWRTEYRGQVLIHAAKGFPSAARDFAKAELQRGVSIPNPLPLAAVVAVARIDHIEHTEASLPGLSRTEEHYGDYSSGRYAWHLADVRPLSEPVPCRGALGLWTPTPDVLRAVEAVLQ